MFYYLLNNIYADEAFTLTQGFQITATNERLFKSPRTVPKVKKPFQLLNTK